MRGKILWMLAAALPVLALIGLYLHFTDFFTVSKVSDSPLSVSHAEIPAASSEAVHEFCGACHAYPPPETFPRSAWRGRPARSARRPLIHWPGGSTTMR